MSVSLVFFARIFGTARTGSFLLRLVVLDVDGLAIDEAFDDGIE